MKRAWFLPGSFFLFCLLVSGCSNIVVLHDNSLQLPRHVEITDTPFFAQQDHQCGPAALATVLNFYQQTVTPEQLVDEVFIPGKQGSLAVELLAASRRHGMFAVKLEPSLDALLTEIAQGHPILVFQNVGLSWLPRWHFAVAIGYDLDSSEIILRSGKTKRWVTPLATFNRTWQRAQSWALAIVPAGQIPATATEQSSLKAASALEETQHYDEAYRSFKAIAQRWPNSALAHIGVGNNAYHLKDYQESEAAFRRVLDIDINNPAAWNNLAYALAAQGCRSEAQVAVQCAIQMLPHDSNFLNSAREIDQMDNTVKHGCASVVCPTRE